jgi:hypothetical protein
MYYPPEIINELRASRKEAIEITRELTGKEVIVTDAAREKSYKGKILAETDRYVIQQSSQLTKHAEPMIVFHRKDDLLAELSQGDAVVINYKFDGKAEIKGLPDENQNTINKAQSDDLEENNIKQDKLFYGEQEVGSIDSEGRIENFGNQDGIKPMVDAEVFLRNSLPEGERYENLLLHSPQPVLTTADALRNLDEIPGNFSINKPERRVYAPFPDVADDIVFAENNLSSDMFFVNSEARTTQRPSFSGYQDKFTAKAYLQGSTLSVGPVDAKEEFGNVIVKPGIKLPFVAENEFTCMRLAGKVGLDVPRTFLLQHPDDKLSVTHLCIERFDFRNTPPLGKRDMMEFASFMGLDSKSKYSAQTEELFEIAEKSLDEANMKKLAKAYFYGVLTGNGDMHTKNFSVFVENGGYRLTPIYDMVNTEVHGFPNMLALPMNESCNPNPSMRSIVKFLERYIDREEMFQLAQDVKQNLPDVLNLAFPQDNNSLEFIDQSRLKFRRNLEESILSRVADVEKVQVLYHTDNPSRCGIISLM